MNRTTSLSLAIFTFLLISLLTLSVFDNNQQIKEGRIERIGTPILDRLIAVTDGTHPAINPSLKGKTILINVWATWCGPCLEEIPELNQLVADFGNREDIVFIALDDLDKAQENEKMKRFNIQFDYQLFFEQKQLIDLLYSYKLTSEKKALPLNVLIDKEGKIGFYYTSYKPEKIDEIREYLTSLNQ